MNQHPAWQLAQDQPGGNVKRYRLIGGGSDDYMDLPYGYRIMREGGQWIARHEEVVVRAER